MLSKAEVKGIFFVSTSKGLQQAQTFHDKPDSSVKPAGEERAKALKR